MTRQTLLAIVLAATTTVSASASPLGTLMAHVHRSNAAGASVAKPKTNVILLHNRVLVPRQVLIGSTVVTLPPNHTTHFDLPAGVTIFAYSNMQTHPAGSVLLRTTGQRGAQFVTID